MGQTDSAQRSQEKEGHQKEGDDQISHVAGPKDLSCWEISLLVVSRIASARLGRGMQRVCDVAGKDTEVDSSGFWPSGFWEQAGRQASAGVTGGRGKGFGGQAASPLQWSAGRR